MIERGIGKGKLTILSSGWQTMDSQLALSSKFVPILAALFEQAYPTKRPPERFTGDSFIPEEGYRRLSSPSGTEQIFENSIPLLLRETGFYRVEATRDDQALSSESAMSIAALPPQVFSVNMAKSEHRTDPLELEEFSRFGIRLDTNTSREKNFERIRNAKQQSEELESKQQYWWWIIIGVLVLTSIETLWGIQRVFSNTRIPATDALA